MLILPVQILYPGGRLPTRAHHDDAGWDFYLPRDVCLLGISNLIPLGIAVAVPKGHVLVLKDRSGHAYHRHLRVAAGVIDSGHRDEVSVLVDHVGSPADAVYLAQGARICQGLLLPIPDAEVEEVETLPASSRGRGGFGSSGV